MVGKKIMKKFIKSNKLISIGFFTSVFICGLYFFPIDTTELWPNTGELFDFAYQLSIGYLLGFIFHILQVYLPEQKRQVKAFEIIREDISSVSYELLDIIFVVEFCTNIAENKLNIERSELYFKRIKSTQDTSKGWCNKFEFSPSY